MTESLRVWSIYLDNLKMITIIQFQNVMVLWLQPNLKCGKYKEYFGKIDKSHTYFLMNLTKLIKRLAFFSLWGKILI